MERVILHCDLNCFYASVEELYRPELKRVPMVVAGSKEQRHGIILAKNQLAKKFNITTGETIAQAKMKCPDLVIASPHYDRYATFSKRVRNIFLQYTDLVEPFGADEAWLDVTHSSFFGTGIEIADAIRQQIKSELGITASVGVSFNKIFAKLGSDLRKPDYTTVISKEQFPQIVWPLKADEMIFVGKSAYRILQEYGIYTIGDLASSNPAFLRDKLGKMGETLFLYANGKDDSEVLPYDYHAPVQSIGNNVTPFRDIQSLQDGRIILSVLSESVAMRLRKENLTAKQICLYFRDTNLTGYTRQMMLDNYTDLADEIYKAAYQLFGSNFHRNRPLRTLGIRVTHFLSCCDQVQLSLFDNPLNREKQKKLETALDDIRSRFGNNSVKKCSVLQDLKLADFHPMDENEELMKALEVIK